MRARPRSFRAEAPDLTARSQPLPDRLRDIHVVGILGENVDHAIEQHNETFHLLALTALDQIEFVAGPLLDCAHTPDEHVGKIVAGAHTRAVEQCNDQRIAFLRRRAVNARLTACSVSVPIAEDGGEQQRNDLPDDSVAAGLACTRLYCIGRPQYYRAIP